MIRFDSFIEYARADFNCLCGRRHKTDISEIRIDNAALADLPRILQEARPQLLLPHSDRLLLVADENTWEACGRKVADILSNAGYSSRVCMYDRTPDLVPDEKAVFRLLTEMDESTACFISIGSGTLNDLTRFVSFKTGKPYICVATAPSMDGYASTMAPMIYNNLKITYTTCGAAAIVADPEVLAGCPGHMLAAGLGDILGKYTALADWSLTVMAQDEYYCPEVADLVRRTADESLRLAPQLAQRSATAVRQIMEALLMTGFAMSYTGNSRPASGAEHHMSHYWEMLLMQRRARPVLHGTKVGLATITVCELYHRLPQMQPDFAAAASRAREFSLDDWEKEIRNTHGNMADELIRQVKLADTKNNLKIEMRVRSLAAKWDQVCALADLVPAAQDIRQALESAGGVTHPDQIGISREDVARAVRYATDLRPRYSILQTCNELGLVDQAIQIVDELFYAGRT